MGTRSKPIRYFDRVHPAVICTGMVCVLLGWLGVLAATLGALYLHLDPEPILKYFGPAAVLVALAGLANQAGVAALKSQLGRIERNTGLSTDEPAVPAQRGYDRSDMSAFHTQPGSYR